jgi:hypothetical protein
MGALTGQFNDKVTPGTSALFLMTQSAVTESPSSSRPATRGRPDVAPWDSRLSSSKVSGQPSRLMMCRRSACSMLSCRARAARPLWAGR